MNIIFRVITIIFHIYIEETKLKSIQKTNTLFKSNL